MKKTLNLSLIGLFLIFISNNSQAQRIEFKQDFESLEKGDDILKLSKKKFNTWGKSSWKVAEKKGKGNNKSNKYAMSGGEVNATLVKYVNLEAGQTYEFNVAVKVTNARGVKWKTNYSVKVLSAGQDKDDTYVYADEQIEEPGEGKWRQHKITFTVKEGKENVVLQTYRWAEGVTLNVDDFVLIKR